MAIGVVDGDSSSEALDVSQSSLGRASVFEPDMFRRQRESIVLSKSDQYGFDEALVAPVALYHAPRGFNESKWIAGATDTVVAWTISGVDVVCRWGPHKDRRSCAPKRPITLIPKGVPNHNVASGPIEYGYLVISDILLSRVASELNSPLRRAGRLRDDLIGFSDDVLREHLQSYLTCAASSSSRLQMEARSILIVERLLTSHHGVAAVRGDRRPGGLAPWQLRRACEAIEARLASDIGLYELAQVTGLSPTHFSRAFKQSTGLSPFNWLRERRIETAKRLLSDRQMSLAEVALALGFSAQPEFTTAFRRVVGVTPGAWRRDRSS